MICAASKKGCCPNQFDGEFGEYLAKKSIVKRVKVYDNLIWIFNKTSDRLITVYPIPERFMKGGINMKQHSAVKWKTVVSVYDRNNVEVERSLIDKEINEVAKELGITTTRKIKFSDLVVVGVEKDNGSI